jgi:methionine synthase I (cobalamin-dependent)
MSTYTEDYIHDACFNAAQLASRVAERAGSVQASEAIARAALGMTDAEYTDGFKWGERASFDDVADSVSEQIEIVLRNRDLPTTYREIRLHAYNATLAAAAFGVLHKD